MKKKTSTSLVREFSPWVYALTPVFATFLFYLPVLQDPFIDLDDYGNVVSNLHIRSFSTASLRWMLVNLQADYWMPLTWFSLALDYAVAGLHPWFFHLHNLLLHCLNTLLVFWVCLHFLSLPGVAGPESRMPPLPWRPAAAALAALLFGLHPLHVESVAWVTERKDLLCGFYFLLSLAFYLASYSRPGWRHWPLWACLGSFFLALMSKPMAVTLPFVFLLLDFWPLQRLTRDPARRRALLEKVPFLALSAAIGWITAGAMKVDPDHFLPMDYRVMNAFHSVVLYLIRMALPVGLLPFYPVPPHPEAFTLDNVISAVLFLLISFACFLMRSERPVLALAWAYYLLMLLPVLGIVQAGYQTSGDRYTYLSSLGPFLLFSCLAAPFLLRRKLFFPMGAGIILLLGGLTLGQLGTWKNDLAFWGSVVKAYPRESWEAQLGLARALADAQKPAEAMSESEEALVLNPKAPPIFFFRGNLLMDMGKTREAISQFRQAISLDPRYAEARFNLSVAYRKTGQWELFLKELKLSLSLNPRQPDAWNNLGHFRCLNRDYRGAQQAFQNAATLDPSNPHYLMNLAYALKKEGLAQEAVEAAGKAKALDPGHAAAEGFDP